jgi:hypothetical protein
VPEFAEMCCDQTKFNCFTQIAEEDVKFVEYELDDVEIA